MQLNWNDIVDLVVVSACGPPGGGRNFVTARYYRHFSMVEILPKKSWPLCTTYTMFYRRQSFEVS